LLQNIPKNVKIRKFYGNRTDIFSKNFPKGYLGHTISVFESLYYYSVYTTNLLFKNIFTIVKYYDQIVVLYAESDKD